jgi:hypothetical protein
MQRRVMQNTADSAYLAAAKMPRYAEFKITDISNNYVKGQAVSGLLKPGDLKTGFQPRLLPWQ